MPFGTSIELINGEWSKIFLFLFGQSVIAQAYENSHAFTVQIAWHSKWCFPFDTLCVFVFQWKNVSVSVGVRVMRLKSLRGCFFVSFTGPSIEGTVMHIQIGKKLAEFKHSSKKHIDSIESVWSREYSTFAHPTSILPPIANYENHLSLFGTMVSQTVVMMFM